MDTNGRLLMVNLTPADIVDSTGAIAVLDALKKRWPGLRHFFADGAYDRRALMDKAATLDFVVEVVRRHEDQVGFAVLPRRWVVERTFGWMVRWRVGWSGITSGEPMCRKPWSISRWAACFYAGSPIPEFSNRL